MRSLAVDVTKTAQPVLVEYLGCGPRDDAPSDENLSETVREATAQVAATPRSPHSLQVIPKPSEDFKKVERDMRANQGSKGL